VTYIEFYFGWIVSVGVLYLVSRGLSIKWSPFVVVGMSMAHVVLMDSVWREFVMRKSLANLGEFFWYGAVSALSGFVVMLRYDRVRLFARVVLIGVAFVAASAVMVSIYLNTEALPETSIEDRY